MPIYDFHCSNGHTFERVVSLAAFGDRQDCDCGSEASRMISAPRIKSDYLEPTRGPDGKIHDSKASYAASCEPEGNPQGQKYEILGDTPTKAYEAPKVDKAKRRNHIREALEEVKQGKHV